MHFIAYGLSYLIWAAWCLTGGISLPLGLAASLALEAIIKAVIWIVPIMAVRGNARLISLQGAFRTLFPWYPTLLGLCVSAAFLHTAHIFLSGIDTWGVFQPYWIFASMSAAVIEEISFRGLLFNKQAAVHGIGKAALINGILFALYHFPEFLIGKNLSAIFGLRFWVITVMGVVFSLSFAKWKNLSMNIVIHFVWNMLCYWFALA